MNEIITKNIKEIITLFENNKVKKAYIFGSVLSEKFNDESDIDLIIDLESNLSPTERGEIWWNDELRNIFNKEIDIINENKIKNPYFLNEINKTKRLIYGR